MKKILTLLLTITFLFAGLSLSVAHAEDGSATLDELANSIDKTTREICEELEDRTAFTDAGKAAAEWVEKRLKAIGVSDSQVQEFSLEATRSNGIKYETVTVYGYNVEAFIDFGKENTVLFSVPLSNHYSKNEGYGAVKAEGALYYATSVAFALEIAEILVNKSDYPYNVAFAFVAGTDEGNFGSKQYVKSVEHRLTLCINVERIGCGNTYFYTGETKSALNDKAAEILTEYGLIEFPTAGKVMLPMQVVDGASYSTYAMRGDFASYVSAGYSALEIIGGDFSGGINGEGGKYVGLSTDDTYENLIKNHPAYASNVASLINAMVRFASDDSLPDICVGADNGFKIFTKEWLPYAIALGLVIIAGATLIIVTNALSKKYKMPPSKTLKVAVFGREFEDGHGDYIDEVKYEDSDPFDGR